MCGRTRYAKKATNNRLLTPNSLCRKASLTCLLSFSQLDLHNSLDIRDPSVHTQARTWVTDYFVGCHASEEGEGEGSGLSVIVGSNEHVFFFFFSLFTHIHSSIVISLRSKGRYRAALECEPARSRITLVFRAVMDRSSQRHRAISAPR